MNFDLELAKLSNLSDDPAQFEVKRRAIIDNFLMSMPAEHFASSHALQSRVDIARVTMTPEKFQQWLIAEISNSLENLNDQIGALKHAQPTYHIDGCVKS